jgi:hypothetical protein
MAKKTVQGESEQVIGVLVNLSDGDHRDHAIKFVAHRTYDRLLCDHVFSGFCQECSQYKCDRRRL